MTKAKTTKRALLMSVLSMMLCMAMLVGSTFAWFTDSVTSGKNRIVAGNLDVELYYNNASTTDWENASAASVANPNFFVDKEGKDILWEPGVMAVTQFKVANVGSLALRYTLETLKADFNSMDGHDLSEVIKFAVIDNDKYTAGTTTRDDILALKPRFDDFIGFTAEGHLLPEEKATDDEPFEEIFTVVAYWEPNVKDDNLYNVNNTQTTDDGAKQLYINIEIQLTASQYTYEEDSFNNQYDRVPGLLQQGYVEAKTADDLKNALAEGKNVVLTNDITVSNLSAPAGTVIDGNGKKIIGVANGSNENQGLWLPNNVECRNVVFENKSGWGVVAKSAKFYNCTFNEVSPYIVPAADGDIVVDGCVIVNNTLQICYNEGLNKDPATIKTTITNNKFVVNNTDTEAHAMVLAGGSPAFWANGAETVTITGNTFTPNDMDTSYIAYFIYGAKLGNAEDGNPTPLTSVPVYSNNTFNGDANYSMNGKADKYQYPLSRESGYIVYESARKITVSSEKGLRALAGVLAEKKPNEAKVWTVDLTADIKLKNEAWNPITTMWIVFNGNGHTISNITCEGWRAGLFGYAGGVTINNLTLENVTSTGAQAGTFAGSGEELRINNCYLKGTNTVTYKEYTDGEYTEKSGGIGAITGLLIPNSNVNVEIVEGATVTLDKSTLSVTEAEYIDLLTGYFDANNGTIINNGTVSVVD